MKHCVLSLLGNDNDNADSNNIIFTIKDTKLYVPVITLSAKDYQKLSRLLSKGLERPLFWNDQYKTKSENKNTANKYRYFIESNFVGANRLFVLICPNHDVVLKDLITKSIIYQKVLSKITTSMSKERTFTTNPLILIQSNLKK